MVRLPSSVRIAATAAACISILLFVVTGLITDDFAYAWAVVSGVERPTRAPFVAYLLASAGYLVIPVVVGLLVSSAVAHVYLRKVISYEEALTQFREMLDGK